MNQLIRITTMRAHGDRYKLTLSGIDDPIVVSATLVYRHRLKEGIVITAPQLEQLVTEARLDACRQSVNRMLAYREHSVGEIQDKLRQKGFEPDVIDQTVTRFLHTGLIDDARYARHLARRVFERKPCWRSYLLGELQSKRISRAYAEQAVDQLLADQDETDVAVAALERKWRQYADKDIETVRQKAYTYLSRKGIGYAASKAAFEIMQRRTNEDSND